MRERCEFRIESWELRTHRAGRGTTRWQTMSYRLVTLNSRDQPFTK